MTQTVVVSDEQVSAAQALVRISGGIANVDPLIAKIAQAEPRRTDTHTDEDHKKVS